ncbi:MAG: hypothetical protein GXO77_04675 [Calditrichaeota bacterium]|nr:hypothetical protein [Calditrichota bacterium]
MKGTIVKCLEELVTTKFGRDKWEKSLEDAGFNKSTMFLPIGDIDDAQVMKIIEMVCKNLNITLTQAADAFGDYWVNVYSQKLYGHYYAKHKTAKDFFLNLDNIHFIMTKTMKNARPPRFDYEWKDDKTLIMHYKSHRGLIDFLEGLAKGVSKFYHENLQISKLGSSRIKIVFP